SSALTAALAVALVLTTATGPAQAGLLRYCETPTDLSAAQRSTLLQVAAVVRDELQRAGVSAALVSRSGLDLRRFGERYSHAGISLAHSPAVPWSVRQLYFDCDERRARLFDQGLAGFLLGQHDARVGFISLVLLPEAGARPLAQAALDDRRALALLGGQYSANAYTYSTRYQNCNQWVAELMASAWGDLPPLAPSSNPPTGTGPEVFRQRAQDWLRASDFRPRAMKLRPRALVLAAPFIPWVHLNDHPEATLQDQVFEVSMPASLEAFVRRREPAATRIELCHTDSRIVLRRGWAPLPDDCVAGPGDEELALR
ncbi:MAG: DUF2145 domain-containing protein, partial [Rubrivivax sp.]